MLRFASVSTPLQQATDVARCRHDAVAGGTALAERLRHLAAALPRLRAVLRGRQTDEQASTVWTWIHDPRHEVRALVVRQGGEAPVGLAHYRTFARPLRASTGCFLDDLFVAKEHRGSGAVDALLAELRCIAAAEGCDTVRWITADNNYRARSKYDEVATRTTWITYDMTPGR